MSKRIFFNKIYKIFLTSDKKGTGDVYDKKIYASYVAVGKIIINVFDMNGNYLYKYISKQVPDEKYHVNEMRVIKRNNKKLLYLLMWQPETEFIVAEIE